MFFEFSFPVSFSTFSPLPPLVLTSFLIFFIGVSVLVSRPSRRPPGPRGLPLLGNALQIPKDRQWLKFEEWRQVYGDVIYVDIMRQPTVILGSARAANDLLDARGAIYSDRPPAIMAGELVGWDRGLGYSPGPPNARFREFRRLFHQSIGPRAVLSDEINDAIEEETRRLAVRLLNEGEDFAECARQSTGSLILRLAYGYRTLQSHDPLVQIVEDAMLGFAKVSEPGWAVDSFPILKYLPEWFPGAGFKRTARLMHEDLEQLYDVPFDFVKTQMKQGCAKPSFTSTFLDEKGGELSAEEEAFVKIAAASLYSGGAETTPSSITSFILAMALNSDVQLRAQAELDAVLQADTTTGQADLRLPVLSDRERLPYLSALVKELWRWNPSVPLGLPHMVTEDNVYRGHYIQKGTVVWANIWSILHDDTVYPDPFKFCPERFLDSKGRLRQLSKDEDPFVSFGFGRRICPGLNLADNSVFLVVATLLYVFNISKVRDENGKEVTPEVEYDGFISHPRPFKCHIEPRTSRLAALILHSVVDK